jgi:hypothetical protein
LKFAACDYSTTTQTEFDKSSQAESIILAANLMSNTIPHKERIQLALAAAGKMTLNGNIQTISMDEATAGAMKNANPAVAAMVMGGAMLANQTPGKPTSTTP